MFNRKDASIFVAVIACAVIAGASLVIVALAATGVI